MSYYSNYDQLSEEEFSTLQNDELADIEIADSELEWRYDRMLNDVYGDVEIAGLTHSTSNALSILDPIAYRVGFSNWLDSEVRDGIIVEL